MSPTHTARVEAAALRLLALHDKPVAVAMLRDVLAIGSSDQRRKVWFDLKRHGLVLCKGRTSGRQYQLSSKGHAAVAKLPSDAELAERYPDRVTIDSVRPVMLRVLAKFPPDIWAKWEQITPGLPGNKGTQIHARLTLRDEGLIEQVSNRSAACYRITPKGTAWLAEQSGTSSPAAPPREDKKRAPLAAAKSAPKRRAARRLRRRQPVRRHR